jgi:hypothetical protein
MQFRKEVKRGTPPSSAHRLKVELRQMIGRGCFCYVGFRVKLERSSGWELEACFQVSGAVIQSESCVVITNRRRYREGMCQFASRDREDIRGESENESNGIQSVSCSGWRFGYRGRKTKKSVILSTCHLTRMDNPEMNALRTHNRPH